MAVKIKSQHATALKSLETQFENDLSSRLARFEEEKNTLTRGFKDEICDLRKVIFT